ncbi:MAG: 3-hydroxyacyl-CoA dehydrogenase NAD-binding domain-containing protein [Vulcanimicrobiaceae bacterium]
MHAAQARQRRDSIVLAESLEALAGCEIAVEAVFEELALKRRVFAALGDTLRADALLATNTSTLDVDAIAAAARANGRGAAPRYALADFSDRLVERRRLGRKSGAGWYRYEAQSRRGLPDAALDEIVSVERVRLGFTPRRLDDAEIVERCVYALVNEGYRLLDEGIARSAADTTPCGSTVTDFPALAAARCGMPKASGSTWSWRRSGASPNATPPSGNPRACSKHARVPVRFPKQPIETVEIAP